MVKTKRQVVPVLLLAWVSLAAATRHGRSDDASATAALESLVQQQATELQRMKTQLQATEERVASLQSQLAAMMTTGQPPAGHTASSGKQQVAFSVAFPGSNDALNIGQNAPIRFPYVVTNIGNGYSTATGVFSAPYTGVYCFALGVRSTNDHGWISVAIRQGSRNIAFTTADGADDAWDKGHAFVTTHLTQGEQVFVVHDAGDTFLEQNSLTNFSGFLLSAD